MIGCLRQLLLAAALVAHLVVASGPLGASEEAKPPVATVLFASGKVSVVSATGVERAAARNHAIVSGTSIVTADGTVQLKLVDGALVSLPAHSQLTIDDYRPVTRADGAGVAFFSLSKGALRFATGGRRLDFMDRYRLRTRAADLAIRRAVFGVRLCRDDCASAGLERLSGGLHIVVERGELLVFNTASTVVVGPARRAHVRDYRSAVKVSVAEPGGLRGLMPAQ